MPPRSRSRTFDPIAMPCRVNWLEPAHPWLRSGRPDGHMTRITRRFRFRQGCAYFCPHFGGASTGLAGEARHALFLVPGLVIAAHPAKRAYRLLMSYPRRYPAPIRTFLAREFGGYYDL